MKIHLDKNEAKEKTGLFSSTNIFELWVRYELNEEEQALLDKHPDVKNIRLFQYSYKGTEINPSVRMLTSPSDKKGLRIVAYNSGELIEYENTINASAKQLKDHLYSLTDSTGSTVTEI